MDINETGELVKDPTKSLVVLDEYILVKQTMKKKKSRIITDAANSEKDKFNFSFEIVQLGDTVTRKVEVGDHPIFGEYVKFSGVKVIEKNDDGMVSLVIVHQNEIIAIDKDPELI